MTQYSLHNWEEDLVAQAAAARERAYAPYSHFTVGAAVLTAEGVVFTGVNVENASYGLTVCAERVAVFNAVAAGRREFEAIAVVTESGVAPCGACRQVLAEFGLQMTVLIVDASGKWRRYPLSELLPELFGPGDLRDKA
jgi:cytidine deaminase